MSRKLPLFYSALLLTGVNLALRFVGTSFQVYLSGRIGAAGIGLLQLVLSVGAMANVAGIAGIRTATMYLVADKLGQSGPQGVGWILSRCIGYSIICSTVIAVSLYVAAPFLAARWIGQDETIGAIRLIALFLPVSCLNGVMVGYFTGAQRIGTLAMVEVAEQLACVVITLTLLQWAGDDVPGCCQAVVLGSGLGNCLTLICLTFLRLLQREKMGTRFPILPKLLDTAVPLAIADDLKTGINTVENLIVPKRLALFSGAMAPLAAFGIITGMVFPILMFPACILYGLAEILIPELAHCAATGNTKRIGYLTRRGLKTAVIYGLLFGGLEFLLAEKLCLRFYGNKDAGYQLQLYALLIPMLYCDAIVDSMTKGLGQQKICVRYNIATSILDVIFLYLLLPKYGIIGYFCSFFITHLLNFLLSLRRLLKITGQKIPFDIPARCLAAAMAALLLCSKAPAAAGALLFPIVLVCLLSLLQVVTKLDLYWLKGLLSPKNAKT